MAAWSARPAADVGPREIDPMGDTCSLVISPDKKVEFVCGDVPQSVVGLRFVDIAVEHDRSTLERAWAKCHATRRPVTYQAAGAITGTIWHTHMAPLPDGRVVLFGEAIDAGYCVAVLRGDTVIRRAHRSKEEAEAFIESYNATMEGTEFRACYCDDIAKRVLPMGSKQKDGLPPCGGELVDNQPSSRAIRNASDRSRSA